MRRSPRELGGGSRSLVLQAALPDGAAEVLVPTSLAEPLTFPPEL